MTKIKRKVMINEELLKEKMEFSLQNKAIAEIAIKVALDYAESVREEVLDEVENKIKCLHCDFPDGDCLFELLEYISQLRQKDTK